MILTGVIVNIIAIVAGALLGQLFANIPPDMKDTVMKVIGIAVVVLGLEMVFESEYLLVVLFSLVLGAVVGEWWHVERKLERVGRWVEHTVGRDRGNVAQAFVTTTLIYCIGAMAVVGALESGLRMDHNVLYMKSFLDGFTALIFSSTLGIGVIFSAIPVFIYQGSIALLATQIQSWLSPEVIEHIVADLTSTGGILIIALGLNLIELTRIKVGNLLPALFFAVVISWMVYMFM